VLLTIDVGNTQTVLGLYDPGADHGDGAGVGLVDHWRLSTDHERTADEYSVLVRSLLETASTWTLTKISGAAICSGVPRDPREPSADGDALPVDSSRS
jgi:type III pantothenate kinase